MKRNRRSFLRLTGTAGIGLAGSAVFSNLDFYQENKKPVNKVIVENATATLADGSVFSTPFWRVESGREGPSLLLIAAQHGNEVQGAEVAGRFRELCARRLVSGNVWLVPMANLQAIRKRRHSVDLGPEQPGTLSKGHNMQQTWPGNPEGNDTERISYSLYQSVLRHCTHAVDMHCWNHFYGTETLTVNNHELSRSMGEVTTSRFISFAEEDLTKVKKPRVVQLFRQKGQGAIEMELSGQFQMKERPIQTGLSSMINIAILLGMIKGEPLAIEGKKAVRNTSKTGNINSYDIMAPSAGIFMTALRGKSSETLIPEDYVREGALLGHIIRESDLASIPVTAPVSGYLWQYGTCHPDCDASLPAQHPYVASGDRVAVILTV
jgi:predicted deacylase